MRAPSADDGTRVLIDRLWPAGSRRRTRQSTIERRSWRQVWNCANGSDTIRPVGTSFAGATRRRFMSIAMNFPDAASDSIAARNCGRQGGRGAGRHESPIRRMKPAAATLISEGTWRSGYASRQDTRSAGCCDKSPPRFMRCSQSIKRVPARSTRGAVGSPAPIPASFRAVPL